MSEALRVVIVAPFSYQVSSEIYFVRALRALGHDVAAVQPWRVQEYEQGLRSADLAVVVGPPVPSTALGARRKAYVLMDHVGRDHAAKHWAAAISDGGYDALLNPHLREPDRELGEARLLLGYDDVDHAALPDAEKRFRAVCVATWRQERQWLARIPGVLVVGNDWQPPGFARALYRDELRAAMAAARLRVNLHFPADFANLAFYESLAMKVPMLTDKWPADEAWEPGKHFLAFASSDEAMRIVANATDAELRGVAEAGHARVRGLDAGEPMNWQRSMRRLIQDAMTMPPRRPTP